MVRHFPSVRLPLTPSSLPFETTNTPEIDAHFADCLAADPRLFDGRVHFSTDHSMDGDTFTATCVQARFATLHYWRSIGFPQLGFRHVFGDVIPRASDGALLLGQMSAQTSNAGKVYFPGGVMDADDVHGDRLDVDHNIAREMAEELGIQPGDFPFAPGYLVCVHDAAVAIGRVLDLPWPADQARSWLLDSANTKGDGEIADLIIARRPSDLDGYDVVPYARTVTEELLKDAP